MKEFIATKEVVDSCIPAEPAMTEMEYIDAMLLMFHEVRCLGREWPDEAWFQPFQAFYDGLTLERKKSLDSAVLRMQCSSDPYVCRYADAMELMANDPLAEGTVATTIKVTDSGMRVRTYAVLERAVEEGVGAGIRHFFKHRDPPEGFEALEDGLREKISDDVMQSITEWFDFPGDGNDD